MTDQYRDHSLRQSLTDEVHARPFIVIDAPQSICHFVMIKEVGGAEDDLSHLKKLCTSMGRDDKVSSNFSLLDFGRFQLRWESHTEFSTWTFIAPGKNFIGSPFAQRSLADIPKEWLHGLPGLRIAATNMVLAAQESRPQPKEIESLFMLDSLAGSSVVGGAAEVWTDFRTHEDGFGRILIQDCGLKRRQAGRLVQRMLEIESYRMMALLGLPVAQNASPKMLRVDRELADIMPQINDLASTADENALLARLIGLGTDIERITVDCDFRFGATKAYHALVERRIEELRETRFEGLQTLKEFVERRLAPAMRTCSSVSERMYTIGERLTRCSGLLRTRVDIAREAQNQLLLNSMDRRAQAQLRLQATVEGLSIVAISYYAAGLLLYAVHGVEAAGISVNAPLVVGLATPVICLFVWSIVKRIRKRIMTQAGVEKD